MVCRRPLRNFHFHGFYRLVWQKEISLASVMTKESFVAVFHDVSQIGNLFYLDSVAMIF